MMFYGLFMERALQMLRPGGRLGLVTQSTFLDKAWAAGLRRLLATRASVRYVVDLNPFGQLFFHAMNTPCITVADTVEQGNPDQDCIAILSVPPTEFAGLNENERRRKVADTVREAITRVSKKRRSASVGFARAARLKTSSLGEPRNHDGTWAGGCEAWFRSADRHGRRRFGHSAGCDARGMP